LFQFVDASRLNLREKVLAKLFGHTTIPGSMQSDECSSCYATAAIAGHSVCVSEGLETAWNGSGYFRQAMATLGVTLFVTTDDDDDDTSQIIEFGDSLE